MKVLVTGVNGQLGHDVINELAGRGIGCVGSDITYTYDGIRDGSAVCTAAYAKMDITDPDVVQAVVASAKPDAIIHCAAWTAVDDAEDEDKQDLVYAINGQGTENIAKAAKDADAKLLYLSTDYVFDGSGTEPWKEDSTAFAPLNVYGDSKLRGEQAITSLLEKYFIVRIAWVFGLNGKNFIKTMLRVGKDREFVTVVDDQIGTPTYTKDLARLLVDMIETEKYGVYHATNAEAVPGGYISWADFTEEIYRVAGYTTEVRRVTTEEYGVSKAKRPGNSRLNKTKLEKAGFESLPDWKDAVGRYLGEIEL